MDKNRLYTKSHCELSFEGEFSSLSTLIKIALNWETLVLEDSRRVEDTGPTSVSQFRGKYFVQWMFKLRGWWNGLGTLTTIMTSLNTIWLKKSTNSCPNLVHGRLNFGNEKRCFLYSVPMDQYLWYCTCSTHAQPATNTRIKSTTERGVQLMARSWFSYLPMCARHTQLILGMP